MTPWATIENHRDNKSRYLRVAMSAPASCPDSDSSPTTRAGKNPVFEFCITFWDTMICITCCPLPAVKPKETLIRMDRWQNGIPSKPLPLGADVSLDVPQRASADCWLSEAQRCHHQHGLDRNQVAAVHIINSSAAAQLGNRCGPVTRAWQRWHGTSEAGKPRTVLLNLTNREFPRSSPLLAPCERWGCKNLRMSRMYNCKSPRGHWFEGNAASASVDEVGEM